MELFSRHESTQCFSRRGQVAVPLNGRFCSGLSGERLWSRQPPWINCRRNRKTSGGGLRTHSPGQPASQLDRRSRQSSSACLMDWPIADGVELPTPERRGGRVFREDAGGRHQYIPMNAEGNHQPRGERHTCHKALRPLHRIAKYTSLPLEQLVKRSVKPFRCT